MPLPDSCPRREIHHRVLDMRAYERADGLYDVEGRVLDRKPYDFVRFSAKEPVPAGEPLHDIWVRLTLDRDYTVRAVAASSDSTPWVICRQAESTLAVLIGERVAQGWSALVKQRLRGAASCTHLMEMLIPLATTAYQAISVMQPREPELSPRIDTCYAYGKDRDVVQRIWHQLHPSASNRK